MATENNLIFFEKEIGPLEDHMDNNIIKYVKKVSPIYNKQVNFPCNFIIKLPDEFSNLEIEKKYEKNVTLTENPTLSKIINIIIEEYIMFWKTQLNSINDLMNIIIIGIKISNSNIISAIVKHSLFTNLNDYLTFDSGINYINLGKNCKNIEVSFNDISNYLIGYVRGNLDEFECFNEKTFEIINNFVRNFSLFCDGEPCDICFSLELFKNQRLIYQLHKYMVFMNMEHNKVDNNWDIPVKTCNYNLKSIIIPNLECVDVKNKQWRFKKNVIYRKQRNDMDVLFECRKNVNIHRNNTQNKNISLYDIAMALHLAKINKWDGENITVKCHMINNMINLTIYFQR